MSGPGNIKAAYTRSAIFARSTPAGAMKLVGVMVAFAAFGDSLMISNAQNPCTYTFNVDHEHGCSVMDDSVSQLKTTVNELQSQISSLLQQNTQLMAKIDRQDGELEDLTNWRETLRSERQGNVKSAQAAGVGAEYIRWGRTVCPNISTLVYSGVAAGSFFDHSGGSSELLCLPSDPEWGEYREGFQGESYVYGSEYETGHNYNGNDVFSKRNTEGLSLHNHNVPCAVCFIDGRGTVKKFPAMLNCPYGWTHEYTGYLMAGHYTQQTKIQAVCVDEAPEILESGGLNENGAILHNMEAACGSLPCPNYVNGRELTCAICSR